MRFLEKAGSGLELVTVSLQLIEGSLRSEQTGRGGPSSGGPFQERTYHRALLSTGHHDRFGTVHHHRLGDTNDHTITVELTRRPRS